MFVTCWYTLDGLSWAKLVKTMGNTMLPVSRSLVERLMRKAAFTVRNLFVKATVTRIRKFATIAARQMHKASNVRKILAVKEYGWRNPRPPTVPHRVSFTKVQFMSADILPPLRASNGTCVLFHVPKSDSVVSMLVPETREWFEKLRVVKLSRFPFLKSSRNTVYFCWNVTLLEKTSVTFSLASSTLP